MMDHFHQFDIKEVLTTHHFHRDAHGFDTDAITKSDSTHLHKYEENIEGNHIFRALIEHVHYVYAIDRDHRLIFLRAFHNFKEYKKFLEDKHEILKLLQSV